MDDLQNIKFRLLSLAVFRNILTDEVVKSVNTLLSAPPDEDFAYICGTIKAGLVSSGKEITLTTYIYELLKRDCNVISNNILVGGNVSKEVTALAKEEFIAIMNFASITMDIFKQNFAFYPPQFLELMPSWTVEGEYSYESLIKSYRKSGCGVYYNSTAFKWDSEKSCLQGLKSLDSIKLNDLKEYDDERKAVIENTEMFVKNLPSNNALLYGDRGTGKSSTVHAILNEYSNQGLKLIEILKTDIKDLHKILEQIDGVKFKFIIFIDDLTFDSDSNEFATLKAALEGSIVKSKNALIYATSNRRHLINETHSSRNAGDDVHMADTRETVLSLSDRFGLVVTFMNPDKKEFILILKQILQDRKIKMNDIDLELTAERYALKKGGRSPRAAKQLADMIEADYKSKKKK